MYPGPNGLDFDEEYFTYLGSTLARLTAPEDEQDEQDGEDSIIAVARVPVMCCRVNFQLIQIPGHQNAYHRRQMKSWLYHVLVSWPSISRRKIGTA